MKFRHTLMVLMALTIMPLAAVAQDVTATFTVSKIFEDAFTLEDVPEVTLQLKCNSGNPLIQTITLENAILEPEVVFVLDNIPDETDVACEVTEIGNDDYDTSYRCSQRSDSTVDNDECGRRASDGTSCRWTEVEGGHENSCSIINIPKPATFTITKEWDIKGSAGDSYSAAVTFELSCNNFIRPFSFYSPFSRKYNVYGLNPDPVEVEVETWFGDAVCTVSEIFVDSAAETENDCSGVMSAAKNSEDSCHFTNTLFFEGIPTLSQYGLALMALLMLSIGVAGFRRFA